MRDTVTLPTHPAIATSQRPIQLDTSCETPYAASPAAKSPEVGLPTSLIAHRRSGRGMAKRNRPAHAGPGLRNWYCDETGCHRTRRHILVLMSGHRFQYCVHCGRRKDCAPQPLRTETDPIFARRVLGRF
ncbi:MAG: hypothetical protein ACYTGV_01845 [Planctomycetota bacterium]|jgi:hypothetical protein